MGVLVRALGNGPGAQFVDQFKQARDGGLENDFALFGTGHSRVAVYAQLAPAAPVGSTTSFCRPMASFISGQVRRL